MSMRAARCSQADIARALRAARQVGGALAVEIAPDGTIRIVPSPSPQEAEANGAGKPVAPKREFSF
jgi:hypothetical protein